MNNTTVVHQFTDDQFEQLLAQISQQTADSQQREAQALSLAKKLEEENQLLRSGLQHFTIDEVTTMFGCSAKQLQRYKKEGKLVPRHMFGKDLYPLDVLRTFLLEYPAGQSDLLPDSLRLRSMSSDLPRPRRSANA